MSLQKKYLKTRPVCKVTFDAPETLVPGAKTVHLVGDFNGWAMDATPMKRQKGRFTATLELTPGQRYQFRYLINHTRWENDPQADDFVQTPLAQNAVAII